MIAQAPSLDYEPLPWSVQLADALAQALLIESDITTRIYLGESGLALQREQAERRVSMLTRLLAMERMR